MALPTKGRVVIETTFGEVDIELWAKETPKTCRNFIALALEGYYDGVIFHRIVPGFLAQTGDRTGTGNGGESFYGEPFEDEIHPRLRYTHRGLVGMANNDKKNTNDSQFFLTLDRADELHGKHTLFGRVIGDTIYNVMKLSEMEIDSNNRPVYPPKIKAIRILDNPFDDIIPRITAAERKAQFRAREDAQREREDEQRRRGAKKNTKLLSFGADEEEGGEEEVEFKKKPIFRPDLVDDPQPTVVVPDFVTNPVPPPSKKKEEPKAKSPEPAESSVKSSKKKKGKEKDDLSSIRENHAKEHMSASDARRAQIEQMEADIRKISQRHEHSDDESSKKKPKRSYLEEELAKYSKGRGLHSKKGKDSRKKDESGVLAALDGFRDKLRKTMQVDDNDPDAEMRDVNAGEEGEEVGVEVDDDFGFMTHALHFPKGNEEEQQKAERDYEVIDPRARNAQAKEEEREKKKQKMGKHTKHGGGHRDRPRR
ncbi:cyclophilin-like protein [Coprinopsis marcescibilis]|uniref:Cyclophilin-like protein n=1 Tax=Coprinopsis marcescibilis TaxID=230819 RepID=A0A5C3KWE0_COPMA|nr:cyclophilin-like protein [Coprinopsis marcescibilis]